MATLDIKYLQDKNDTKFFPVTHVNGVIVDTGGTTIQNWLNAQLGTKASQSDVNAISGKTITAGTGLTGGGAISANPTVALATVTVTGYTGSGVTTNTVSYDSYGRVTSGAIIIYSAVTVSSNNNTGACPTEITGTNKSGSQANVLYVNADSSADYTVTIPTTYKTTTGAALELTCPKSGYCEVNYLNIGGVIYARGV